MRYVIDDSMIGKSVELGCLKILWLFVEKSHEEYYYVLYYEKLKGVNNSQGYNIIAINDIEIKVPSLSSFYQYHVFFTRKDIDKFLNNNDIFTLLKDC